MPAGLVEIKYRNPIPHVSRFDTEVLQIVRRQHGILKWDTRQSEYTRTWNVRTVSWIRLPEFTVNGIPVSLEDIHFQRRLMIMVALINC